MKSYKVSAAELKNFTKTVFEKTGLQESDAQAIAELLVHADVRGVSSHGVIRMKALYRKDKRRRSFPKKYISCGAGDSQYSSY